MKEDMDAATTDFRVRLARLEENRGDCEVYKGFGGLMDMFRLRHLKNLGLVPAEATVQDLGGLSTTYHIKWKFCDLNGANQDDTFPFSTYPTNTQSYRYYLRVPTSKTYILYGLFVPDVDVTEKVFEVLLNACLVRSISLQRVKSCQNSTLFFYYPVEMRENNSVTMVIRDNNLPLVDNGNFAEFLRWCVPLFAVIGPTAQLMGGYD